MAGPGEAGRLAAGGVAGAARLAAAGADAMRTALTPVVQESTPSMIARRVREAIGDGEFAPGAQLGEADLAKRLGVSRGPLREGLQRLTQEGLLISIRNRGLFVVEMNPANVADMYLAREAVERAAAAQVHRRGPEEAAAVLLDVVARMRAAADAGRAGEVGEADIAFHEALVALARSARLSRTHETLITETRMCIHALERAYESLDERVAEHEAIARSFLAGDARATDRLVVEHMRDAVRRLTAA